MIPLLLALAAAQISELDFRKSDAAVAVHRKGQEAPLLVLNAKADERPFLHPLLSPDGRGILTELSPGHHKHQTGIYVGILKVNGRDYFHNRGADYYRRRTLEADPAQSNLTAAYDWLGADKNPILVETQRWTFSPAADRHVLDLEWSARAGTEVTFQKHDYGGLFIRMPWKGKGEAVNSDGQKNGEAEGKRARWIDIGMPVEGRDDWAHIVVMDHPSNPSHPIPWRVDGQLGVGPSRSRLGDWKIAKGETVSARYRFLVYTGPSDTGRVEAEWTRFQK